MEQNIPKNKISWFSNIVCGATLARSFSQILSSPDFHFYNIFASIPIFFYFQNFSQNNIPQSGTLDVEIVIHCAELKQIKLHKLYF